MVQRYEGITGGRFGSGPGPGEATLARTSLLLAGLVLLLMLPLAGLAQPATPTAADLEAFFDAELPALMEEHRVPGVAIAVVADGEARLLRGYGLAQIDPPRDTTADTPFGTGSVAKLFTWTALMQQFEQGAIELDADVNEVLGETLVPATYPEPVTVRHLMTHTPGFEDRPVVGLFARDPERMPDLGDALARNVPARVIPPGVETSYSNYGTALAGYLVERVSGTPFHAYAEANILAPLGMTGSSLRQPLPSDLAGEVAIGYVPDGEGGYLAQDHVYVPLYPAGGMVMSAADAARFMLALLGDGSLEGERILAPETVLRMRETLFTADPRLPGNAYGFWESHRHGERWLTHGGDALAFHTLLAIAPERNLGFYLATNAATGTELREALWEAFLDRFLPVPAVTAGAEGAAADLARYAGLYGTNRVPSTTLAKIAVLFQTVTVRAEGDALVASFLGQERRWLPQGDGLFADAENEGELVLFRPDEDGRMAAYLGELPMMVFRPLRWFERPGFQVALLGTLAVLLLSGLVGFPLAALLARRGGQEREEKAPTGARLARLVGWLATLLLTGFILTFFLIMSNTAALSFGLTPVFWLALVLGLLGALAVALFGLMLVIAWLLEWWHPAARIHATLVGVAAALLLWQMNFWNLLGFRI